VLAGDLTLLSLLLAWGVKSKFKSSDAMLAGISNFALCGAMPADFPISSEEIKVLKVT
jgi:hypothetical protein